MKNQAKKSFLKTAAAAAVALTLSGSALADVSITPMKGKLCSLPKNGTKFSLSPIK